MSSLAVASRIALTKSCLDLFKFYGSSGLISKQASFGNLSRPNNTGGI